MCNLRSTRRPTDDPSQPWGHGQVDRGCRRNAERGIPRFKPLRGADAGGRGFITNRKTVCYIGSDGTKQDVAKCEEKECKPEKEASLDREHKQRSEI